jgi:hypothetical protein
VTRNAAANKEKKTDDRTMMRPHEAKPNLLVVVDPPEAQTLTLGTTKQALQTLIRTDCAC